MYVYDEYDQRIIEDRVKQFRDQTRRYLAGELSEEEFRPPVSYTHLTLPTTPYV